MTKRMIEKDPEGRTCNGAVWMQDTMLAQKTVKF